MEASPERIKALEETLAAVQEAKIKDVKALSPE
jgi:hypothetical protein